MKCNLNYIILLIILDGVDRYYFITVFRHVESNPTRHRSYLNPTKQVMSQSNRTRFEIDQSELI